MVKIFINVETPLRLYNTYNCDKQDLLAPDRHDSLMDEGVYDHHAVPTEVYRFSDTNIGQLCLTIWTLGSHLALIGFILCCGKLRRNPKNILIINILLTNLLVGFFIVPFLVHLQLTSYLSCPLRIALKLCNDYLYVFLFLMTVLSAVIERSIFVIKKTNLNGLLKWIVTVILFLAPWIIAAILILPLFYVGMGDPETDKECVYTGDQDLFIAAQVVSYILPGLLIVPLALVTGVYHVKKIEVKPLEKILILLKREAVSVISLVTVFSLVMEVPSFVVGMLNMTMHCTGPSCLGLRGTEIALWVRIIKISVYPFLWLAYSDIRSCLPCVCFKPLDYIIDHNRELKEIEASGDTQPLKLYSDTALEVWGTRRGDSRGRDDELMM
ncbi:hypothetical protein LOTGIDRAFT_164935 [Lottia gigantea]|uniref:G-protein coupled receptors family 1 profile domain-containing protein n=1 Tax=Lottia gigantea TaxID=225164 RepID=V4A3R7_LOTGI|nr:hypothetical protein LOTGIDRAFT_164935 [Lottia gigantea]ESO89630.1 hypothetical protein LOTGIDRAFT_164935 [Lottia gigantea]